MGIEKKQLIPSSSPEEIKKILLSLATNWGDVIEDTEAFQVIPLKGAMTNEVYQINWPATAAAKPGGEFRRKVLVRVYGEGVEIFFNRDDEIKTFECMSTHGQGPKLLGRFKDGRVEEFIHAMTLSAGDLRDREISALIAAKMREFHSLDMPGPKNVHLWQRLRTWLGLAKKLYSPEEAKELQLDILEEEIKLLEKELPRNDQEIGFCHNDLQYGNIMMDEQTRVLTVIDYEYASYNPVAYDIANHFCEMAANYHTEMPHVLDYSIYPDLDERRRFIRTYLMSSGNEPSDAEVEQLVDDVEKYTLANHIFWGLWGIISGHVNKIDFDYMEYARQRFAQYRSRKPLLFAS